jgi:hypothetical protein
MGLTLFPLLFSLFLFLSILVATTTTVFGLYEDATSEYFEQRGFRIYEYSFEDNGTLVIYAEPT